MHDLEPALVCMGKGVLSIVSHSVNSATLCKVSSSEYSSSVETPKKYKGALFE